MGMCPCPTIGRETHLLNYQTGGDMYGYLSSQDYVPLYFQEPYHKLGVEEALVRRVFLASICVEINCHLRSQFGSPFLTRTCYEGLDPFLSARLRTYALEM